MSDAELISLKVEFMDKFNLKETVAEQLVLLTRIAGVDPVRASIHKRLAENKRDITVSSVIQTMRHLPIEVTECPPGFLQTYARKKWKKLRRLAAADGSPIIGDGY